MKYFKKLDLPIYQNVLGELEQLLNSGKINWGRQNQICLNTTTDFPDSFLLGAGSLEFDWSKVNNQTAQSGVVKQSVPLKDVILNESDFTELCPQFEGTVFEKIYHDLKSRYHLGRIRIIKSEPKSCMSWHYDRTPRIHLPIKTQEGCFMVINDEVAFLEANTWWGTNTVLKHTAFNGSRASRIHLVAVILDCEYDNF